MSIQLDLFAPTPKPPRDRIAEHIRSWEVCWPEWDGPRVGGYCEVHTIGAQIEGGGYTYCYMELCRLLQERPDGSWLAVIEMGEIRGEPWIKDGTRLILPIDSIWPPVRLLRQARDKIEA